MGTVLGPTLGQDGLDFVEGYPASQAALARLDPADAREACRFELYWRGLELANGFHELADAEEQRQRFAAEAATRAAEKSSTSSRPFAARIGRSDHRMRRCGLRVYGAARAPSDHSDPERPCRAARAPLARVNFDIERAC